MYETSNRLSLPNNLQGDVEMKMIKMPKKQCGFFDLGLSFAILAITGATAYVSIENHEEAVAANLQSESAEVVYNESKYQDKE